MLCQNNNLHYICLRIIIMIVKRIAKYLTLLLLVVIATLSNANEAESMATNGQPTEVVTAFSTTSITPTTDSGNISSISHSVAPHTIQLTGTTKRTNNAHKHNFEFIATGKAINSSIENCIFKKSSTINTSFTKPEHRLIRLGKLII